MREREDDGGDLRKRSPHAQPGISVEGVACAHDRSVQAPFYRAGHAFDAVNAAKHGKLPNRNKASPCWESWCNLYRTLLVAGNLGSFGRLAMKSNFKIMGGKILSKTLSTTLRRTTLAVLSAILVSVAATCAQAQQSQPPHSIRSTVLKTGDGIEIPLRRGGDFQLFHSHLPLSIQVRLAPSPDDPSAMQIVAIAMMAGHDLIEIYLDDGQINTPAATSTLADLTEASPVEIYPLARSQAKLLISAASAPEFFTGGKIKDGFSIALHSTGAIAPVLLTAIVKDTEHPDSLELTARLMPHATALGLLRRPDGNPDNDLVLPSSEVISPDALQADLDKFVEAFRVPDDRSLFSRQLERATAAASSETPPIANAPSSSPDLLDLTLLFGGDSFERNVRYPANGYYVIFQEDGNFCLYREAGDAWVWCINNDPAIAYAETESITLQMDGRLTGQRADGSALWQFPAEAPGYETSLTISEDGALQVLTAESVLWSSRD